MAARWRGTDGDLNTGNGDFVPGGRPDEVPVYSFHLISHQSVWARAHVRGVNDGRCRAHGDTWLIQGGSTTGIRGGGCLRDDRSDLL